MAQCEHLRPSSCSWQTFNDNTQRYQNRNIVRQHSKPSPTSALQQLRLSPFACANCLTSITNTKYTTLPQLDWVLLSTPFYPPRASVFMTPDIATPQDDTPQKAHPPQPRAKLDPAQARPGQTPIQHGVVLCAMFPFGPVRYKRSLANK